MSLLIQLRILASGLSLLGYFWLLFYDQLFGVSVKIVGGIMFMAVFTKAKSYDLTFLSAIYTVLDINKFIQLLLK
jgi:hypothetical protein